MWNTPWCEELIEYYPQKEDQLEDHHDNGSQTSDAQNDVVYSICPLHIGQFLIFLIKGFGPFTLCNTGLLVTIDYGEEFSTIFSNSFLYTVLTDEVSTNMTDLFCENIWMIDTVSTLTRSVGRP